MADLPSNPPPPRRLLPRNWPNLLAITGLVWAVGMTTLSLIRASDAANGPANRPVKAQVAPDMVTSDSCRACHPGNYASWHASYHRTMTQVAKPANFATEMDGLEFTHNNRDYRVDREDQKYVVRWKPAGAAKSAYADPRQIVLLTGSHIMQVFWLETGDRRTLGQFPFAYLIGEAKWAPVKDTFLTPPGMDDVYSKGDWNSACINCHVTQPRPRPIAGTEGFDSHVGEFGISCEACHSGGREHIEINRNPLRRFMKHFAGQGDPTIVNPAHLSGPASSLVCAQCHSVWAFTNNSAYATYERDGADFRPGQTKIDDLRWIAQPNATDHAAEREYLVKGDPHFFEDRFWSDGQLRVIGREYNSVAASPCFKGGKFGCVSCHELHPTTPDAVTLQNWRGSGQLKPGMETSQACLQCHPGFKPATALVAHTHHAADSPGSDCYNCHMPRTIYGLLKATRSHEVALPNAKETAELGRMNACNLCHLDQPLAWTAAKLAEWYGQPQPKLAPDDHELATGAKWILQGDARQRAVVAYNMGWGPAQRAAKLDWFYPYLIFELNDPYSAVRFGAWKSLQTLPGFSGYKYDYIVDDAAQKEALALAYRKWWFEVRQPTTEFRAQTILEPNGSFRQEVFDNLLDHRDKKKVTVVE